MTLLVIDVGTSGVRAAVLDDDGQLRWERHRAQLPETPAPGAVEFDADLLAETVLELAHQALAATGPVRAVGVANQRASTVVWDRGTGRPVGPALGWQDLRTVGRCLAVREQGLSLAPNHSATKLAHLLDEHDPQRRRDLAFGTVDSWLAWTLSGGALHVTDPTNAGVTGLRRPDGSGWDETVLAALSVPARVLPQVVDSCGVLGAADALPGAPPLAALVGDQQASLVGQGCLRAGQAKVTFGTGGMLDLCLGAGTPPAGAHGCVPIVAWTRAGHYTWGLEAVQLAAGSCVEWLRDDLGLISSAAESEPVAAGCADSGGVVFVPALLGLGTPHWDYGARGTLLGLTRGSGRAQVVRAVLEGIAQRGADLLAAAEAAASVRVERLRVDGGMSTNRLFCQALADATGRPVEPAPRPEATTLGAGYLAGLAVGVWSSPEELAALWRPREVVDPLRETDRTRWHEAVRRAREWLPELSAVRF